MANPLTKKTSFLLLRTNPRLTSNIKLISDSKDNIFLESFDNTGDLSQSKYKGFKVSSESKYSFDVSKFYGNGSVPNLTAYNTFEDDDYLSAKSNFNRQYDFKYNYGSFVKTSKLYTEEFACFAPLWIEPNNIPDYFVIFKTKNPVSVSTLDVGSTAYDPRSQESLDSVGPSAFFDNIIKNSDILKTVDLTERTNIGKYIRSHANDDSFPESPISVKWNSRDNTTWNGISIDKGGFISKTEDVSNSILVEDKTIREFENFMTNGFRRNGVVCANILNMEFLFDDIDEDDFQINRYWGAYVSEAELGRFQLNSEKLFSRKNLELSQTPQPAFESTGSKDNTEDQLQSNPNGIKVYFDVTGGTSIPYAITNNYALFGYVKDKNNQLYSISNGSTWNDDELRLDTEKINWKDFSGFDRARNFVDAEILNEETRSHCILTVDGQPSNSTEIRIKNTGYKKGFIGDDILQSGFTAHNFTAEIINYYTIDADDTLIAGQNSNNSFSSLGTNNKIAEAIAGAINDIQKNNGIREIFTAKNLDDKVIIVASTPSETLNELILTVFSDLAANITVSARNTVFEDVTDYIKSPVQSSPNTPGKLLVSNLIGANSIIGNKVKVLSTSVDQFNLQSYLKTNKGYSKIKTISDYLDIKYDKYGYPSEFIDFGKYKIIEVEDEDHVITLNSSKKCSIFELADFGLGFISFYPIRDFDNNLFSTEYSRDGDGYPKELEKYLGDTLDSLGATGFTGSVGGTVDDNAGLTILCNTIGASSSFVENEEFNSLRDIIDERDGSFTKISNEYDRLKENEIKELALPSKVIPYINKWVYDDLGEDVRSNPYRLSPSESFGFSNFSPSFKHFLRDPKFFTHEWYILGKYPPFLTFDQKKETFSYFDENININDLYDVTTDKFKEYFTVDSIGSTSIPTQLRYSIFSEGSDTRFAETFCRGVKVLIKDREESSTIVNYNLDRIKYKQSPKYNGYRFSSILTFNDENNLDIKVIKNEKFKNVTFLISANLQDSIYTAPGYTGAGAAPDRFIDRSLLYTMNDELLYSNVGTFDASGKLTKNYTNNPIDGQIKIDIVNGIVNGEQNNSNSSTPNYIRELVPQDNGSYGEVVIHGTNNKFYVISGIFDVQLNTFKFKKIIRYSNDYDIEDNSGTQDQTYSIGTSTVEFLINSIFNSVVSIYRGGGKGKYTGILESLSLANIAELINKGDRSIEYITIDSTGATSTNEFIIELLEPEYINKASFLQPANDNNRPTSLTISSEIGSQLAPLNLTYIQPISRYDGNYSPKFNDVITFNTRKKDLYTQVKTLVNDDESKADILLSNTVFDYERKDFGKIKNLYYNKVNEENPKSILEISSISGFQAKYPKINEIAIDNKDFYTFLSSWDPGYYDLYKDKSSKNPIIGTRSMTEKRSFFGSKMMSLPDEINLETFRKINLNVIEDLRLIENFDADVVFSKELDENNPRSFGNTKVQDKLYLDAFIDIALTKWLLDNGVGTMFDTYVNPKLSFGSVESLEDDKIEYIKRNILDRYYIEEITFWEQRFKTNEGNLTRVELSFTDTQKINNEYTESRNYRIAKKGNNDLRFRLIYNIGKNDEFSISMSIKLKKK